MEPAQQEKKRKVQEERSECVQCGDNDVRVNEDELCMDCKSWNDETERFTSMKNSSFKDLVVNEEWNSRVMKFIVLTQRGVSCGFRPCESKKEAWEYIKLEFLEAINVWERIRGGDSPNLLPKEWKTFKMEFLSEVSDHADVFEAQIVDIKNGRRLEVACSRLYEQLKVAQPNWFV